MLPSTTLTISDIKPALTPEQTESINPKNFSRFNYLIVTIICEYKILRFWGSDRFAGINFCDFTKSS